MNPEDQILDTLQKMKVEVGKKRLKNLLCTNTEETPAPKLRQDIEISDPQNNLNVTVLVGCTGSVASIKLPELLSQLNSTLTNVDVEVILTEKAKHFCHSDALKNADIKVHSDYDLTPVQVLSLSEELAHKAVLLILAPLDANTLAKIANGICDNLLTSVARSWNCKRKYAVCCPAMNTQMWKHPITNVQIKTLESFGFVVIPPISKLLACGDYGVGAMAEPHSIVSHIKRYEIAGFDKELFEALKMTNVKSTC